MVIGSNNSLTYLEPTSWWAKIFRFFTRHQRKDYQDQYKYSGVRVFDLRLYADKNSHTILRNGWVKYFLFSFYEVLDFFNKMGDVKVLITLDESFNDRVNSKEVERVEKKFENVCSIIESIYPDIMFFGGYRKFDKKVLYEFKWEKENGTPRLIWPENYSVLYNIFNKICPFVCSFRNKKYIERLEKENGYLMLNFVDRK